MSDKRDGSVALPAVLRICANPVPLTFDWCWISKTCHSGVKLNICRD